MAKYPDDADGNALQRVEELGNNMGKPMPIDFFVAVPTAEVGGQLANLAAELGYKVTVEYDEEDDAWTCYCTKLMVPTYLDLIDCQAELDNTARRMGGKADGWGTVGNKNDGA